MFPPGRWLQLLIILVGALIPTWKLDADTYSDWKARVFSQDEQANPAISGELAPSPAGDGIPNLLKYAFDLDPHQNGAFGLPQISSVQIADPVTGQLSTFPTIHYRIAATDQPADLSFVPEFSLDLQTWTRGDNVFAPPTFQPPANGSSDPTLVSSQGFFFISKTSKAFLRVRIVEGQTLPDDWQVEYFGHTGIDPNGDPDGDGRSNFDEFLHGTDPNDF